MATITCKKCGHQYYAHWMMACKLCPACGQKPAACDPQQSQDQEQPKREQAS